MSKILKYWSNVWVTVSMTGNAKFRRSIRFNRKSMAFDGVAQAYGSQWVAIFNDNNQLVFYVDNKNISFESIESCKNSLLSNTLREFSVELKSGNSMKIQYKRKISKVEILMDPTLDAIDEMHSDLLFWFSEVFAAKSTDAAFVQGLAQELGI